jgi:hypothetical protein
VVLKRTGVLLLFIFSRLVLFIFFAFLSLTAETVQGTTLPLEGVDDVHGCDGLTFGVFGVSNGVADHVFQEDLEYSSRFLVDQAGYTLDTSSASETSDSGLGDALDVITQNFAMTLGATFSQTFATFTSAGHDDR